MKERESSKQSKRKQQRHRETVKKKERETGTEEGRGRAMERGRESVRSFWHGSHQLAVSHSLLRLCLCSQQGTVGGQACIYK